jgi:hypothetical protein
VPDGNGNRTTQDWLQLIFTTNEEDHRLILVKMNNKAEQADMDKMELRSQEDMAKLEVRMVAVENKSMVLALKIAALLGAVSFAGFLAMLAVQFFGAG